MSSREGLLNGKLPDPEPRVLEGRDGVDQGIRIHNVQEGSETLMNTRRSREVCPDQNDARNYKVPNGHQLGKIHVHRDEDAAVCGSMAESFLIRGAQQADVLDMDGLVALVS